MKRERLERRDWKERKMEPEEIELVKEVIRNVGDSFWTHTSNGIDGNWGLFAEIVEMLNEEGLDLKLVRRDG